MSLQQSTVGATSGDNIQLDNATLAVWSKEILWRAQPNLKFESIAQQRTELGTLPGNQINFLKYDSLSGDPQLSETATMDSDVLSTSTISINVYEQGKAVGFSEYLLRSSFLNLMDNASTALGMHYAVSRDNLIRDTLLAGANVIYSQNGGTAASRADLTTANTFNVNLIRDAVEFLATNKAPKFGGDAYVCFVHPHQARYLRADPAWINIANYAAATNLLKGEIGRIEDVRFVETSQVAYIPQGTQQIWADNKNTGNTTTVAANNSTAVYRSVIVGDYAVGIADGLPVEMRDNGVVDFGRKHALAWYAIYGAGLIETAHSCILETA